jgi:hypothetical protein
MAIPLQGQWKRLNSVPYAGASVWGTGVNPVHGIYGEGPPLRVIGRNEQSPSVQPINQSLDASDPEELWGYTLDINWRFSDFVADDRPPWNEQPPQFRSNVDHHPAWNQSPDANNTFRGRWGGAHRKDQKLADSLPSETVSEGWLNKVTGTAANSVPSDYSQLIVTTSQVQRYKTRVNNAAVDRATDAPRAPIESRVEGQVVKSYSGQEPGSPRYYDMTPYQADVMLRPFRYRTGGTDDPAKMAPNEMYVNSPMQRIPPPDPSMGIGEPASPGADYGYTGEDSFYA